MAAEYRLIQMMDITEPDIVEITVSDDGPNARRVWINIDGVCRLRACRIKKLVLPTREE